MLSPQFRLLPLATVFKHVHRPVRTRVEAVHPTPQVTTKTCVRVGHNDASARGGLLCTIDCVMWCARLGGGPPLDAVSRAPGPGSYVSVWRIRGLLAGEAAARCTVCARHHRLVFYALYSYPFRSKRDTGGIMAQSANKHASATPILPMRATGTSSQQLNQLQAVQEITQQTCLRIDPAPSGRRPHWAPRGRPRGVNRSHHARMS